MNASVLCWKKIDEDIREELQKNERLKGVIVPECEIKNAIITSSRLGLGAGGLTGIIELDYGGVLQGFGNYQLYCPKRGVKSVAGHFILRIIQIAGVEEWDKIIGKAVRVKADHQKVHAIGHIIKDDWFLPWDDFKDCD